MQRQPDNPFEIEQKEPLVKALDSTNPAWGMAPSKRPIEEHLRLGVIPIDKPSGPSSHEVVAWTKRMLGVGHAGHAGTLDPAVTGALPVALQDATKALTGMIHSHKEYICIMRLHSEVSLSSLEKVAAEFIGQIYQRPPLRSAVKREVRIRKIYYLQVLEMQYRDVLFRVGCQAGTYIRKLCYDIGNVIGCGAHMKELRRTKSGPFTESKGLVTLQDLSDAYFTWKENKEDASLRGIVKPVESAVEHLKKLYIRDSAVDAICHGASLAIPGLTQLDAGIGQTLPVAIMTMKGELVALGRSLMSSDEMISSKHGLVASTERVIMQPSVYPRMWS